MVRRHDLTDAEGDLPAPLMPAHLRKGQRWADHRRTVNAILFRTRTRTGVPWRGLPERGPGRPPRGGTAAGRWTAPGAASPSGCVSTPPPANTSA
ncbi:transposase [Marinitenerispora sediminis]|uniref:transposase n=1 Tax=Marinitenerispora sediminis TaxID=1931232 RepID=UPI0015F16E22